MLDSFIDLIASWLPLWQSYLLYIFVGFFVAFCGAFIISLFRRN